MSAHPVTSGAAATASPASPSVCCITVRTTILPQRSLLEHSRHRCSLSPAGGTCPGGEDAGTNVGWSSESGTEKVASVERSTTWNSSSHPK